MKKAVMYGAGNIGRGFIGQVFSKSGYTVCFLDIVPEIIEAFNSEHKYNVRIVSNEKTIDDVISNVYGVYATSYEAVLEIAECDIMATAVGVNIMPKIAPVIAKGVSERIKRNPDKALDIILAENQLNADIFMRKMIYEHLAKKEIAWADKNLGLVEASIGRMVPRMTEEQKQEHPLLVCVEPYAKLPVDSKAFKGKIPDLVGLVPYTPFGFYIKRKLFLHNMGHAVLAYLGYLKGYEYIYQAAEDNELYDLAKGCMMLCANALNAEYRVPLPEIIANVDDLLFRFCNRALKDTVLRVGADPIRKLRYDDRLIGAALYSMEQGYYPAALILAIIAALKFDPVSDESAKKLRADLKQHGIDYIITNYMGLNADYDLGKAVKEKFNEQKNN